MGKGLVETVRAFEEVYIRLFSDEERSERYQVLKSWINEDGRGGIPSEIEAMNKLLDLLREKDTDRIRGYLESGNYNTICCGFYDMPVDGSNFFLHNETIPDHFAKTLRLYDSSSMPFYFVAQEGVTTLFFDQLQDQGRAILERCHEVKKEILSSDERFRKNTYDAEVQSAYLLGEASRLDTVREIAEDMKEVYGTVTQIIQGVGN